MSNQGMVDKEKLEMFNLPIYEPCSEEVVEAVSAEGSFEIVYRELFVTMPGSSAAAPPSQRTRRRSRREHCARHTRMYWLGTLEAAW
ncbi:Os10g0173400 [Oryza sativa Japonica Group]|uniref:Os10g0173400 protein n=1 Tax=Oryza sativa subsp. japonica TaxID=39947 RepID=A0A0P0XS58_ORYSJ|nr:Os10g0173400 [Oryza sativa Japonica Group]